MAPFPGGRVSPGHFIPGGGGSFFVAPFALVDAEYEFVDAISRIAQIQFREAAAPGDNQIAAPRSNIIVATLPNQFRNPDSNNGTWMRVLAELGPDPWRSVPAGYAEGTWLQMTPFVIGTGFGGPVWEVERAAGAGTTAAMEAVWELSPDGGVTIQARATITLRASES